MIKWIYGRDGQHSTCYLTRIKLTPKTRWGQLYFHIFHRGDLDRDFHDHPYDFWTFPLRTYYEDVLDLSTGRSTRNEVEAFHWHFRPAEYSHVHLGVSQYQWAFDSPSEEKGFNTRASCKNVFSGWTATFVWHKPTRREWGFWEYESTISEALQGQGYYWIHWRRYLSP